MEADLEQPEQDAPPIHPVEPNPVAPPSGSDVMATWAQAYAANNWPIFPVYSITPQGECTCGSKSCKAGKHSRIEGWPTKASCDPEVVARWWKELPGSNIGMPLGDDILVLDIDPKTNGLKTLAELEAVYGEVPRRAMQVSGSGGYHFFFKASDRIKSSKSGLVGDGIDLLTGSGQCVILAPSRHKSGGVYRWEAEPSPLMDRRDQIELLPAPEWVLDLAEKKTPAQRATRGAMRTAQCVAPSERVPIARIMDDALAKVRAGEGRNNTGLFFFTQLRDNSYTRAEASAVLREFVAKANEAAPGADRYTMEEAKASLRSAFQRDARAPWKPPSSGLSLVQEMEEHIVTQGGHRFARDKGDMLYHFTDGVYRPNGVEFLRSAVREYCETHGKGTAWHLELPEKLCGWILSKSPKLWDCPPLDTVNLKNGLLEVRTRTFRPHDPEFLSPIQLEASYDPSAECPAIEKFIADTFPDDARHIPYEIAAWLMLPDTAMQKAVLAVGEGSNGKSVFLTLLGDFLGKENLSAVDLHKIEADKFAAARLYGKLANICADLPTASLSGTSLFKAITGGDYINAERKYQPSFEFRPYARLVFSANTPPRSDDPTHGFFRRWLVIPFTRVFDEKSPDWVPHTVLKEKLRAELSGFLNRALDALPTVQRGTFTEPVSLKQAREEFRRTTDPLSVWLDANTVEVPEGHVLKARLREMYTADCRDHGRAVVPENVFTERLRRLRPRVTTKQRRINGKPFWCFVGIGLKTQESEGPQNEELGF